MARFGSLEPETNLARTVDLAIFPASHLYSRSPTDPEGLLGTAPALVTALSGYWCGRYLKGAGGRTKKAGVLAGVGVGAVLAGWLWSLAFPLNKSLWTGSYVIFTSGWAMVMLAVCLWAVDVKGWRVRPLEAFGLNAIMAFVGSGLMARVMSKIPVGEKSLGAWVYEHGFRGWPWAVDPRISSLAYSLCFVAIWWVVVEVCRRKRWMWKV